MADNLFNMADEHVDNRERKGERCHSAGGILDFELVAHQAAGCHASS